MVQIKLSKNGIRIKKYSIRKFTPKKAYFEEDVPALHYSNQPLITQLLKPQIGVTGKSYNGALGKTNYSIEGISLVLEKDVERVVQFYKEEGPKVNKERIQELKDQIAIIESV